MAISAELLYLTAREDGWAYALTDQLVNPRFHYHFGAQASISWQSSHDCWTFQLQGLHFHARTNSILEEEALPTMAHPIRAEGFTAASTECHWRLHTGWIDLTLARPFPWITPYFGFKFAGVRHKARIDYFQLGPFEKEDLSMKNKFWGFGPQLGLEGKWGDCWGLYGKGAVALLFGSFYLHQDEEDWLRMKLLSQFWLTRGFAEASLGLFYRVSCVEFRAGWQMYQFFGQNLGIKMVDNRAQAFSSSNLGDLTLAGWSAGLVFRF